VSVSHDDELAYRYELKINQYELERMWWEDLMQNSWLSGDHKIVLHAIRHIIQSLRYDWDKSTCEPVLIWMGELVRRTGLGESTVRRLTEELDQYGLITKKTKRGKEGRNQCWYTLSGQVKTNPKNITIVDRRHGGARPRCKCGSDNLEPTGYKCLDCGCQWKI
jgi:DNA-binding MarR family transcriptional regulator